LAELERERRGDSGSGEESTQTRQGQLRAL